MNYDIHALKLVIKSELTMNLWMKSILIGLGACLVFYIIKFSGIFERERKFFAKPDLYTVTYKVQVEPNDVGNEGGRDQQFILKKLEVRMEFTFFNSATKALGENTYEIKVKDCSDTALASLLLTQNSKLEFTPLYNHQELSGILDEADKLMRERQFAARKPIAKPEVDTTTLQYPLKKLDPEAGIEDEITGLHAIIQFTHPYQDADGTSRFPSEIGVLKDVDTAALNKLLSEPAIDSLMPPGSRIAYGQADSDDRKTGFVSLYFLRTYLGSNTKLGTDDILMAVQDYGHNGIPEVSISFNDYGAKKWSTLTKDNVGRSLAVVVNNSVILAPYVNQQIDNGSAVISGGLTTSEAKKLAAQISSGIIPARVTILERKISKQGRFPDRGVILYLVLVFALGFGSSVLIFKLLKNS